MPLVVYRYMLSRDNIIYEAVLLNVANGVFSSQIKGLIKYYEQFDKI